MKFPVFLLLLYLLNQANIGATQNITNITQQTTVLPPGKEVALVAVLNANKSLCCTGTVVGIREVLTAGSCAFNCGEITQCSIGIIQYADLSTRYEWPNGMDVMKVIFHPDAESRFKSETVASGGFDSDLAIILLLEEYNEFARSNWKLADSLGPIRALFTAYQYDSEGSLYHGDFNVTFSYKPCPKCYCITTDYHFGDSGAPLQNDGTLYGISTTSVTNERMDVFANVGMYKDWIMKVIKVANEVGSNITGSDRKLGPRHQKSCGYYISFNFSYIFYTSMAYSLFERVKFLSK